MKGVERGKIKRKTGEKGGSMKHVGIIRDASRRDDDAAGDVVQPTHVTDQSRALSRGVI